jgi:hypothetical protein
LTYTLFSILCLSGKTASVSSNITNETKGAPFSVVIPKGTPLKQIAVRLSVTIGDNNSNDNKISNNEIGYKNLLLPYLLNTPVYTVDHRIDSSVESKVKTVHIANINFISKLYLSNKPIAFHITKISLKKILQDTTYQPDFNSNNVLQPRVNAVIVNAFLIIKWKDQEIFRTNVIMNVSINIHLIQCC